MKNASQVRSLEIGSVVVGIGLLSVSFVGHAQAPATPPAPAVAPLNDLKVPAGFRVSVFASDLPGARMMTISPEGVLLVARRRLRFYTGAQFPSSYRNALFLALHGSSTIPTKVGYKVVRAHKEHEAHEEDKDRSSQARKK